MAHTFMSMVEEATAAVDGISAAEAGKRMSDDSNTLIVDVRDAADVASTGLAKGGINVSLGMLPIRADTELPEEWRSAELQDRSRPVIVTCQLGPNAARGAKVLKDMGFTDVTYMDGGMEAWNEADLPTE